MADCSGAGQVFSQLPRVFESLIPPQFLPSIFGRTLEDDPGEDFSQGQLTKTNVPAGSCDPAGTKWGMGVRQALFPVLTLGAQLAASFPTLFSTASGVSGLVAGPSSALPLLDFE